MILRIDSPTGPHFVQVDDVCAVEDNIVYYDTNGYTGNITPMENVMVTLMTSDGMKLYAWWWAKGKLKS